MIKNRFMSFKAALLGIKVLWQNETNFRIEIIATVAIFSLAYALRLNLLEWIILTFCVAAVLVSEALNTSLEEICNAITLENDPRIKLAKDIAAAAVLLASLFSLLIGLIIFLPHLFPNLLA